MSRDFSDFMAACAVAYKGPNRDAVKHALGSEHRVSKTDAIEAYSLNLVRNAERRNRLNASGSNSHSGNTKLVLLKPVRSLDIAYLDELTAERVSGYLDVYEGTAKTVRSHRFALGGLVPFSSQRGWLSADPLKLLDSPDLPSGLIEWVKLEDFPKVLDAVKGM